MRKLVPIIVAIFVIAAGSVASADTTIYFEDTFEGDDLTENWELINPNPDAYLVGDNVLTLLSADGVAPSYESAGNVLRLNMPLPKGDWTLTTRFTFAPQTMGEAMRIGVAKDNENSMLSSLWLSSYNYALTNITVRADKLSRGAATSFSRNIYNIEGGDLNVRSAQFTDKIKAVHLRLKKTGRKYESSVRFESVDAAAEGAVSEEWSTVQKLTSLRAPGDAFVLIFSSNSNSYTDSGGESLVEVDWVKIEVEE